MDFSHQEWPLERLIGVYGANKMILNPPYQRNAVWNLKAQQALIETILLGQPLPNFFFHLKEDGVYEVVDGQQRIRTILGYWKNVIPDLRGLTLERRLNASRNRKEEATSFLTYPISVCVITNVAPGESVEEYYAKVNSSGLRINRPELKKAEHFTTNFLRLLQEATGLEELQSLRLFSAIKANRMNDLDFVSELIATLKFGISDKKEKVDELYEDDISNEELDLYLTRFKTVLQIINHFDRIRPIIRTRYKQKNDFYSLFYFVSRISNEQLHVLEYFYRVLVKISPFIRPSQTECEPLMNYAYHCVTQSNSKHARQERHNFLTELLLGHTELANEVQKQLSDFFQIPPPPLQKNGNYFTLRVDGIVYPEQTELTL